MTFMKDKAVIPGIATVLSLILVFMILAPNGSLTSLNIIEQVILFVVLTIPIMLALYAIIGLVRWAFRQM